MLCMMNGIKDFDHVDNFYVSWISKKSKEEFPFYYRAKAGRKFKSIANENSDVVCENFKSDLQSNGIFGNSQTGDNANGVKIFPLTPAQSSSDKSRKLNNSECQMKSTIIYLSAHLSLSLSLSRRFNKILFSLFTVHRFSIESDWDFLHENKCLFRPAPVRLISSCKVETFIVAPRTSLRLFIDFDSCVMCERATSWKHLTVIWLLFNIIVASRTLPVRTHRKYWCYSIYFPGIKRDKKYLRFWPCQENFPSPNQNLYVQ